ncbi:sigma-54-dependent Fis family transcriptional regulator [Sulfurospirillum diekertiae]|jgi:two-component system NtrC family response regulator|uniref:Response regulator n=1 Tax=Sulfurospirillum diekertiae TaxID=1854492 RepID=A0A290HAQ0_9BACT|nr:sigma-54 dependent transcriptional regulator [Sulfurospirillum diekertiae]ATB68495.1 response regulator [Sulfurospirillum diekertiae]QIR76349.1 sigma-54-dependent Fis family transcriptional regulator [Sulfurospirillum diekertiae]QIR78979.1 sigma-54-dependent Fis family transcriptional regulator [Sulfurospirillum diekertiae]
MHVAIVEDDINMRKSLEIALGEYEEFKISTYKSALDALKKIDSSVDLIVTDINMPGMDGIEFIKKLDGAYDIIVITGNATLSRAIESVRLGVKDFLTKPFEIETLVEAIKRHDKIRTKVKESFEKIDSAKEENGDFIATSPELEKALTIARKAAKTDVSVLLLGESGVGKELFANYVHKNSPRAKNPFVAINMAAIPENLLESELFGYEKGAFTDAIAEKKGYFEVANGGTLFLDEIGEMPMTLQAKLLRVIQERVMVRVGGTKELTIDVRIVSATNADIKRSIKEGHFREDLYYRLNTIPIEIAPLRQRKEEILPICEVILERVTKKYGLQKRYFSEEAIESLMTYRWPGNIRELISVVERAVILSDTEAISKEDLFLESRNWFSS